MSDIRLGGYVRLYRKILDNPAFRDAGEAMFFAYLVLLANWKAGERRYDDRLYRLDRGEFVIGERKLAEGFDWSRQKVRGLLSRLEAAEMLTRKSAQHGDQRAPVLSICNYDVYQAPLDGDEPTPEPRTAQGRPKDGPPKKEGKEGKEGKEPNQQTDYAFSGSIIRLTWRDFSKWSEAYRAIPDLRGALQKRDDWLATLPATDRRRRDWFVPTSNWLAKEQEKHLAERAGGGRPDAYDDDVIH